MITLVAMMCTASAQTLVVPSSVVTPPVAQTMDRPLWMGVGAGWGVQDMLYMGQPADPQLQLQVRAGLERTELRVSMGGVLENRWGYAGVRYGARDGSDGGLGVVVGYDVSLPSRTLASTMGTLAVGQTQERWGWSVGGQLGIASSPMPNQRPLGVNMVVDAFAAGWIQPARAFQLGMEATVTPYTTTAIPRLSVVPFVGGPEKLRGLRLSLAYPLNLTVVDRVDDEPARTRLDSPFAAAFLHFDAPIGR